MLKKALLANSIFSTSSGLIMLMFAWLFVESLLLPLLVVKILACGLLAFAGVLIFLASNLNIAQKMVIYVIAADAMWVFVTFVLLLFFAQALPLLGIYIAVGISVVVAGLAVAQYLGLRQYK